MRVYIATALLLMTAASSMAQPLPGDPDAGRAIAMRRCLTCHVVDNQTNRGTDGVPTFTSIARHPRTTELGLRVFLQTPHPPMPDLMMSRREIDDVVSYILTLRTR